MRTIKLTNTALMAKVDDEDFELVSKYDWRLCVMSGINYAYTTIEGKQIGMHNLILPENRGFVVDHLNNNGLSNWRSNLRYATKGQNTQRQLRKAPGSSKYRGVKWDKINEKWISSITVNYKYVNLGRFNSEKMAARVYNEAAVLYFGKDAFQNEL